MFYHGVRYITTGSKVTEIHMKRSCKVHEKERLSMKTCVMGFSLNKENVNCQ